MRTDPRDSTINRLLRARATEIADPKRAVVVRGSHALRQVPPAVPPAVPLSHPLVAGFAACHATWPGRSGRLYGARIEPLITCRAPARAAYVLVLRDARGRALPAFVGLALSHAPTLNLARIRRRAASLGAKEVHMIDLAHTAGSYVGRRLVRDVRAGVALAA